MSRPRVLDPALRRLPLVALVLLLVGLFPGCGLLIDLDPPDGNLLECFVTLRNPDGEVVEVSSRLSEEFLGRDFFLCTAHGCPDACDFSTVAAAEADWRNWVQVRLDQVAAITDPADPLFGSDFRTRPGPWCEVEGTLRCERREALANRPSCPAAIPTGTPPVCTAVPPGPACVEVSCPGATPCTGIAIGDLPVGETTGETVTVSNCGDVDARVQIDETVIPLALLADFEIPAAANGCRPRDAVESVSGRLLVPAAVDPAESSCSFDVLFRPTAPGDHFGRKRFSSSANPTHEIDLRGHGVAGSVSVVGPADEICFPGATAGPCTPERSITVTNGGPGAVTVTDVRVEESPAGSGFELVAPPPPPLPVTLRAGESLTIRVRWCRSAVPLPGAILVIDTDDPDNPTIFRRLTTDIPTPCAPGT